jgi:DNA-binding CsgD family transcriptional regulator
MSAVSLNRQSAPTLHVFEEISATNRLTPRHAAHKRTAHVGLEPTCRMADALSAAGQAIALVGSDGCVVHMNTRFRRLIGDGVHLKAERLACWDAEADRALSATIDQAIRHNGLSRDLVAAVVLPRRQRVRPLVAQVVPVSRPSRDAPHPVAVLVILTDLESSSTGPLKTVLQRAFRFTPAEAHLASRIAQGRTLADISRQDGAALETLRTRLKGVFSKTGTRRQTELALLLSKITLPAD